MSEHSHKEILTICSIDGKSRKVRIKINANKLVVCPEWKICPDHGKPDCQMLQMHNEIIGKTSFQKRKNRRKRRRSDG